MLKIAATQFASDFLNKERSTARVCECIQEASYDGAKLIAFPECAIPGYPAWGQFLVSETPAAFQFNVRLFQQSVEVPGPEVDKIIQTCRDCSIIAIVGINERIANTTGTMYNTQLIIGPDGLLLKHQKFVPTLTERLVHTGGQTGSLATAMTEIGPVSALICGENLNPLAQYSVSLSYPIIHVASWPPHFAPGSNTYEDILDITRAEAKSLGCFVVNAVGIDDDAAIEEYTKCNPEIENWLLKQKTSNFASIIGPGGQIVSQPMPPGEGILYAEIDLDQVIGTRMVFDVAGHYNRPEIFAHHFEKFFKQPK